MPLDLRDFWQRLQTGVEVAVAGPTSDKLLGVRDGFQRYFRDGLGHALSLAVVPQGDGPEAVGLPVSDEVVIELARRAARDLEDRLGDAYHLYVGSEAGLDTVDIDGTTHWFVRNWTVVKSPVGEAVGGSGAVELPHRLIEGLGGEAIPLAVPGTRRRGGIFNSLTGGLENRRRATELATVNALSTLFYGMLETRPRG